MKKISIIMATYKTDKEIIDKSINSILNQTYSNIEFIIVCDGDKKEYRYLKEKYNDKRIILLLNEENMGLPYSLNKAINFSTGDYIARMDSDDISLPNRLELQIKFLEKNSNIDICSSYAKTFGKEDSKLKLFFKSNEELKIQLLYRSIFIHPAVFGKREVFENFKYNVEYKRAQDYELWSRIVEKYNVGLIPKILLNYRVRKKFSDNKNPVSVEYTKNIIENNSKKITGKYDDKIYNCLAIFGGIKKFTKENYEEVNNDIDYILANNKKYNQKVLKRVLYNRYFELMIKNKIFPKNFSEFKKCFKFYNLRDIIFKII